MNWITLASITLFILCAITGTAIFITYKIKGTIKCIIVGKDGHSRLKRYRHTDGKIRHKTGTYVFTEQDIIKVGRQDYLVFYEGNPHALYLKYLEPPVLDAEAYDRTLKMEGIKAMQMLDEERRKHEILMMVMLFVTMATCFGIAYGVFKGA